jgi:cytosine/adenosine deaminase-related metal-dependent hydrolase
LATALAGGALALQRPIGTLAPGARADVVVLDADHPDLAARSGDYWLDAWIFVAGRSAVKAVLVGGDTVVEGGRHAMRPAIEARFKAVVAKLAAA